MTETTSPQGEALRREALSWVSRIVLGEATKADIEALRLWRDTSPAHAAALADAGRLWRGIEMASEKLVSTGAVSVPTDVSARTLASRRALLGAGVAAAAAAVGVMVVRPPFHLWPSLAELSADHRTSTGERRRISIVDSVSVEMNTQTSIAVQSADAAPTIELIAGEVAVTVAPSGPPFVVIAGNGRITARHGTFNLNRNDASVSLICIDGDVGLQCEGRTLTLRPGMQISYDASGSGDVGAADPARTAWRNGMLVFHDTPLVQVIAEVNRYRSGRVILMDAALGRRTVTARFELDRLDTVVLQIRHVFKAPVKSLPGGIVLVG
jgi:transmembrane sensor